MTILCSDQLNFVITKKSLRISKG